MRKKNLSGIFALALLATTGYGVSKSMKSDAGLSDLALMNVEALAVDEVPVSIPCVKSDGEECVFKCVLADGTQGSCKIPDMTRS